MSYLCHAWVILGLSLSHSCVRFVLILWLEKIFIIKYNIKYSFAFYTNYDKKRRIIDYSAGD